MAAKSIYLDNAVLNLVLRAVAYAPTTGTVYVGLFTSAPTPSTSGTECSGTGYARAAVTFGAAALGVSLNSGLVTFPTAGAGGWGLVVAAGIFDDAAAGNLLYFGNLGASKTIDAGDTASFAISALSVTEQ